MYFRRPILKPYIILHPKNKDNPQLVIIANPRQKFTVNQFDQLKMMMSNGTSFLVLLNEQGRVENFAIFEKLVFAITSRILRILMEHIK